MSCEPQKCDPFGIWEVTFHQLLVIVVASVNYAKIQNSECEYKSIFMILVFLYLPSFYSMCLN